jgi:hypothetical protein
MKEGPPARITQSGAARAQHKQDNDSNQVACRGNDVNGKHAVIVTLEHLRWISGHQLVEGNVQVPVEFVKPVCRCKGGV